MTVKEFQTAFERITPPAVAWKNDNVGLQIGDPSAIISAVIVALDATMDVALEAKKRKANLVVTHHPLLFHPIKNIIRNTRIGNLVQYLIENKINLYAAHTNLDSVKWGVNFTLAKAIHLEEIKILSPTKESLIKIAVFVPLSHLESVAEAMHGEGAGTFTKYDLCSFRIEGIGTFRGMNDAKPYVGNVGKLEKTTEYRLEMLCETWKINSVVSAMLNAHPYEEVAYDLYPLLNSNTEYGFGAIGNLIKKMPEKEFLSFIKRKLHIKGLRYSSGKKMIQRVAVCGGSGSEFIQDAINQNADAMITADIKYHTFQNYEDRILLIDAGHHETEHLILPDLSEQIKKILSHEKIYNNVFVSDSATNPIKYY